jgi:hypothetical protein
MIEGHLRRLRTEIRHRRASPRSTQVRVRRRGSSEMIFVQPRRSDAVGSPPRRGRGIRGRTQRPERITASPGRPS